MSKTELVKGRTKIDNAGKMSLEQLESEIAELCERYFEDWFQIAGRLLVIREGKKFKQAGFDTWDKYVVSGRLPAALQKSHATRLISAAQTRPFLAEPKMTPKGVIWTERTVRPLTTVRNKDKKLLVGKIKTISGQALREAEQIAKKDDKPLKLTASIVSKYVKRWKLSQSSQSDEPEEQTMAKLIAKDIRTIQKLLATYETFTSSVWTEITDSQLKKYTEAVRKLADFLEEC